MTSEISITDFVDFNPKRTIQKGTTAPFIDMAALPVNSRDISEIGERVFKGGGSRFMNGDTLFARITPCLENGKTAKVSGLPKNVVASGSTEFIVMAAKDAEYDEDYVYYLARLPEFRSFAQARMEGTSGRQRVPWQSLAGFTFDFPDKEVRKVIGRVLKVFDDKIQLNRQTNQTLEQIAQAIFKSWFVDFEPTRAKIIAKEQGANPATQELAAQAIICGAITLEQLAEVEHNLETTLQQAIDEKLSQGNQTPINAEQLKATAALFPNELVESELGDVPKGWQSGSLENICFLNKTSWTRKTAPSDIWYVDLANTKNGVIEELTHYIWEEAPSRARRVLDDGDTIVGTVRPGNRSFSFIGKADKQLTASTGFAVLTPKQKHYKEYIYLSATSDENIDRLTHLADGGAYPAVRPNEVVQVEVSIPTEELMIKFSDVVSPLFDKRVLNLQSENILKMLRDALLPKLLSGELDISALADNAEADA